MVSDPEPPLCVDLDGTLIAGDTLLISLGLLARRQPWRIPIACARVVRGRAAFKAYIASCLLPDAAALPWRTAVLEFLASEHRGGRRIILTTAADHRIAACVAEHLGFFDAVISTRDGENLRGNAKLAALRKLLGDNDFDFVGDSFADLPLLLAARKAYLVAPPRRLLAHVSSVRPVERVF